MERHNFLLVCITILIHQGNHGLDGRRGVKEGEVVFAVLEEQHRVNRYVWEAEPDN